MAKPEWGVKRVCQSCAIKFYDMARSPITCPKCGARFDPEALLKSRRNRPPAPPKVVKPEPGKTIADPPPKGAEGAGGADVDENEDTAAASSNEVEKDDSVLEDTSDLGGDDLAEVASTGDDKAD